MVSSVHVKATEDYSAMERRAVKKVKIESQKVRAIGEGKVDMVPAISLC